ncbi:FKBP-type peptidyl-prolyl cis-trans isomerase [Aestuariispira insulae]|uniref:Peptidyl-prolyl cis-trans isomerase n=1 Tax=Aestuariispira insulae TaxID=1461337 RepID=A0A3D9HRV3_9PROT|nr:FKBP-type peptidyl-prolyl cis-trans isomerase [Aestuariispira insulae]RED52222.1 peptidylprolyl isomerase [Aestuariispira insulae]
MKFRNFLVALLAVAVMPVMGMAEETVTELQIEDTLVGTGEEAVLHSQVQVHYTGTLMDGTKFDSSLDRQQPFEFLIGFQQVIAGWEQGVQGMKVGGKRVLVIPPQLAYGERGAGEAIPPNATLRFEIELLAVEGPGYTNVDAATMRGLINKGAKMVDIRGSSEWTVTGVIEGASLLTAFGDNGRIQPGFPESFEAAVTREDKVVLIGSEDERSSLLALILVRQAGYPDVYNLTGGVSTWRRDGGDLIAPPATAEPEAGSQ